VWAPCPPVFHHHDPTRSRIKRRKRPARRKNDRQLEIVCFGGDSAGRSAVSQPEKATLRQPPRIPIAARQFHTAADGIAEAHIFQVRNAFPSREWNGRYQRIKRMNRIAPCAFSKRSPRNIREECETQNRPATRKLLPNSRRNCRARRRVRGVALSNFNRPAKRRDCKIRSYQETSNDSQIRQPQICRLRLAPASGISGSTELWPSG